MLGAAAPTSTTKDTVHHPDFERAATRQSDYTGVDFAAVSAGMGAWARRVETMEQLDAAVRDALSVERPAVIDAVVDPGEYFPMESTTSCRTPSRC